MSLIQRAAHLREKSKTLLNYWRAGERERGRGDWRVDQIGTQVCNFFFFHIVNGPKLKGSEKQKTICFTYTDSHMLSTPPPHALLPSLIVTILNRARIGGRSCECKRISQRNKPFPTSSFMNPLNVPLSVKVNLRNYCRIIYFKIRSKNHYLFHTLFTNNHYIFSLSATQWTALWFTKPFY